MSSNNYSDLIIEQYLIGELPEDKIAEIESHIKANEEFARKIESLKKANAMFFKSYPASEFLKQVHNQAEYEEKQKSSEQSRSQKDTSFSLSELFSMRNVLSFSAALAAILMVVLFSPFDRSTPFRSKTDGLEVTRIKGSVTLMVYRKGDDGVEVLGAGAKVRSGDLLQISYLNTSYKYGAILSVDGRGIVSRHLGSAESGVLLEANKKVKLANSYQLDDAPDFEKFYFFYSNEQFEISELVDRIESLSTLDPEKDIHTDDIGISFVTFLLYKE